MMEYQTVSLYKTVGKRAIDEKYEQSMNPPVPPPILTIDIVSYVYARKTNG